MGLHPGGLGRPSGTRKAGGTHPTGMLSCCKGVLFDTDVNDFHATKSAVYNPKCRHGNTDSDVFLESLLEKKPSKPRSGLPHA